MPDPGGRSHKRGAAVWRQAGKLRMKRPGGGSGCARLVRAAMPVFNPLRFGLARRAQAVHGMKAAMTGMGSALRGGRFLASAGAFAALAAAIAAFGSGDARAQNSADCARLQPAIASAPRFERRAGRGRAAARGAGEHRRLRPFDRLRQPEVPVLRFESAAAVRRNQRARSPACKPISPICRRAPAAARRPHRPLQRGMRQCAAADQHLRGAVRRGGEAGGAPRRRTSSSR